VRNIAAIQRIKNTIHKIKQWEYWPMPLIYGILSPYIFYHALKARTLFFYTACNPGMEMGGLLGNSKDQMLQYLPGHLKPATIRIESEGNTQKIIDKVKQDNIAFPLIAKPDQGERGTGVSLLQNIEELQSYNERVQIPYLIQEYIDFPFEAGVLYHKMPGSKKGKITSIVIKEFLSVEGNGTHTLGELIYQNPRAAIIANKIQIKHANMWNIVLKKGETYILEPIGNHNRGTKFLNGNHLITQQLIDVFDDISRMLPGFYYGRFDLKAPSLLHFLRGKGIKIMEINGVNAEPAHIYDPKFPLLKGLKTILWHWNIVYKISMENIKNGVVVPTNNTAWKYYKIWRNAKKNAVSCQV
jgi:hypothetical protein